MVQCQGLPDGPCPQSRCDASVHNTIYDLFLCDHCERIRDQGRLNSTRTTCNANSPKHNRANKADKLNGGAPDQPKTDNDHPVSLRNTKRKAQSKRDANQAIDSLDKSH